NLANSEQGFSLIYGLRIPACFSPSYKNNIYIITIEIRRKPIKLSPHESFITRVLYGAAYWL
ncbi:MAG TPA: hypothetical protein VK890_06520, partial [Bacteroidia bacterium]|nr:hypothetical protein [Bacteroidia bacterium]